MERKLSNYLPTVVRDYDAFQGILAGEQAEFEQVWGSVEDARNNQYISTAGDFGLSRWEQILELEVKGTDTLENRRFRILTRLNEELPYTLPKLRTMLDSTCGAGNATVTVQDYQITVRVGLVVRSNYTDVETLLKRVIPQNMKLDLSLLYNRNSAFSAYTHAQMAAYTHYALRNEVFA
jgi:hypothetical protein